MSPFRRRRALFLSTAVAAAVLSGAGSALLGVCGPFTDVSDAAFCPFVLEIFSLGITTGTTPTTYDPTSSVNRLQMAAFLSRSVDRVLKRGSRRAALDQFWTTQNWKATDLTPLESFATGSLTGPLGACSDGINFWIALDGTGKLARF